MSAYEDWLRQQAGIPIQQGAQAMGQVADQGVLAAQMKLQAMKALAQKMGGAGQGQGMAQLPPQNQMVPEVLPNAPSMTAGDAQSRMGAMIQAPDQMAQAAQRLKAQAELDAAAEKHQNDIETQDMSGYSDVPKKFDGLKKKLNKDEDDE